MTTAQHTEDHAASVASSGHPASGWRQDVGGLLALALVSLAVGCLVNVLRADSVPWAYTSRANAMNAFVAGLSTNATDQGASEPVHEIRLEDFQGFVATHQGLVIDARPKVFYEMAHVPAAVSLPRETFAEEYPRLRAKLEAYKDRPVAVYCSGADCTDSQLVANALGKLGFRHVLIYTSGWEEWSQTGLSQDGAATQP